VQLDGDLLVRARAIRAIVLDVDGVLTDSSLFYGLRGEALKCFSARDGFAMRAAQDEGLWIAILSGRVAPPLRARIADLGILPGFVVEGSRDKGADLRTLAEQLETNIAEVAFMGDDVPDLAALSQVGLAACPADAVDEVRARCHFVSSKRGGEGAVRELIELILTAKDRWSSIVETWSSGVPGPTSLTSLTGLTSSPRAHSSRRRLR
jgi:3-deoxy-D-manno-octulosonate 8-phosphate phosphatase (KDO 8-P phosphatase)